MGFFVVPNGKPEALSGSPMGFYRPYSAVVGFQQGESEEEDMEATLGKGGDDERSPLGEMLLFG